MPVRPRLLSDPEPPSLSRPSPREGRGVWGKRRAPGGFGGASRHCEASTVPRRRPGPGNSKAGTRATARPGPGICDPGNVQPEPVILGVVHWPMISFGPSSRTFYANNRWLRRPGPWPGAEAVTSCRNHFESEGRLKYPTIPVALARLKIPLEIDFKFELHRHPSQMLH